MAAVIILFSVLMLLGIVGYVLYTIFAGNIRHVTRGPRESAAPDPTWTLLDQSTATDTIPTHPQHGNDAATGAHHAHPTHHHHHHCDHGHSHIDPGGSHSVDSSSSSGCDTGSSGSGCSD